MDDLRLSIAILTLDTPEIRELGEFTSESKRAYCRRHGYRFVRETQTLDAARPPSWSKVKLLQRELPRHDLCLWIDADAIILNLDTSIETILRQHRIEPECELIISADQNGINGGVFFIRNTPRSRDFFEAVYARAEFADHPWWEQAAMTALLQEGYPLRVATIPKRAINSYQHDYRPGDFILHTPATPDRLEVLKRFAKFGHAVDCPLFSAHGVASHGSLAAGALGYDSSTGGKIVHPRLVLGSDDQCEHGELLSAHANSRIQLTLHAPAEVVGFLNASATFRPENPVEFFADHNLLGRVAGPCGMTAPVLLPKGEHILQAIHAGSDFRWRHSCWRLRRRPQPPALATVRKGIAAPERLAIVTVACYDESDVPARLRLLTESAQLQNVWLTVWGVGEPYVSHTDAKVLRFRQWLKEIPREITHVLYLDGRDTVLQGDRAAICDSYNELGAPPILFSAEQLSCPVGDAEWRDRWPAGMSGRSFLNAGCFIAERQALSHALDVLHALWIEATNEGRGIDELRRLAPDFDEDALAFALRWKKWNVFNDQYLWQTAVMAGAVSVQLDDRCRVAATLSTGFTPVGASDEWEVRGGKLRARGSPHEPAVIHVPGIAPIEVLHAWAGLLGLLGNHSP